MYVRDISGENVFFESFSLKKGFNRHGECRFRAFAPEELAQDCLNRVGDALYVASDEDHALPLFCGVITSVAREKNLGATSIEIIAQSPSIAVDKEPRRRIFQNPEKTFGEIVESLDLDPCDPKLADAFKNAVHEPVVLQLGETDFELLLRLAKEAGLRVWINDQREDNPALVVAPAISDNVATLPEEKIVRLSERNTESGWSVEMASLEHFEPGQKLKLGDGGREYLVLAYDLETTRGLDMFNYQLGESGESAPEKSPERTAILQARVKDAADPDNLGRVRVAFENLEDCCGDDKRLWLPFRPAWSGKASGTVFVPDPDDLLETIFVNGELYASATLRENPLLEECRQVADKCIGNNSGQRIFWREKSLDLLSSENLIHIDEEKIELVVGENQIAISKDGIQLKTPDARIELAKNDLVMSAKGSLSARSDGKWQAESGSGLEISASSDAEIRGSSVAVKASGGKVKIGKQVELGY